jgi:hypothetical protein
MESAFLFPTSSSNLLVHTASITISLLYRDISRQAKFHQKLSLKEVWVMIRSELLEEEKKEEKEEEEKEEKEEKEKEEEEEEEEKEQEEEEGTSDWEPQ